MGLGTRPSKNFLRIADGKIRMKTDKDDPKAKERISTVGGKEIHSFELVYDDCTGFIKGIFENNHPEYGLSYSLDLYDPSDGQTYSLQMGEKSRYFQTLAMMLPNIDFGKPVTVTPYSFKNEGKSSIGLSFKQDGVKIPNYYRKIVDSTVDPPKTEPCNGLEQFDFTSDDKDDIEIEQKKQRKFLKSELKKQIIRLLEYYEENPEPWIQYKSTDQNEDSVNEPDENNMDDAEISKAEKSNAGKKKTAPQKEPKGKINQKIDKSQGSKSTNKKSSKSNADDLPY